jgi:signal peptidase I
MTGRTTTLALDPETDATTHAADGTVHGPRCYLSDGRLTCGWPEQHDPAFVQFLYRRMGRTIVVTRPTGGSADRIVTALMVAVAVTVMALVLAIRVAGVHYLTVLSGSMRPTFSPGDVAVTQPVPVASLRVGDVIAFYPPGETVPVLHRITSIQTSPTGMVVTTRGDANPVEDDWHATLEGTTAYRLVAVVPFVGWLTEFQRLALIFAGLLMGLWVLLELRKEVKARPANAQSPPQS